MEKNAQKPRLCAAYCKNTELSGMKRHLPNAITLLNLFLGCCAIVSLCYGQFASAIWLILACILADYADGLVARALNVHSELGKQLDSLADVVSFGVVPGVIFYQLLLIGLGREEATGLEYAALPAFVLSAFSCLRLAKFNLDTRQEDGFLGLPTPSSTMFAVGLLVIQQYDSLGLGGLVVAPAFLYLCIGLLSFLLVSEIPMFSLKLKSFRWAGNEEKLGFVALSFAIIALTREAALSFIILLYIGISLLRYLARKAKPA
jgi:CDP-diacylglycerol---serine O-phosphatidyltransferase